MGISVYHDSNSIFFTKESTSASHWSIHSAQSRPTVENDCTCRENTDAYLSATKNHYVNIIGHPDDSRYEVDYHALVEEAKNTERSWN